MKYNLYFMFEHVLGYDRFMRMFGSGLTQLYAAIDGRLNGAARAEELQMRSLASGAVNDRAQVNRHALKKPMVFRGAANDWACVKNWNFEFFEERYGHKEVFLLDTVGAVDPENPQQFEKISLRDYLSQLRQGSHKYLKFSNLVEEHEELQEDLDMEWMKGFEQPGSFSRRFYSFLGGKGTVTPLHNEFPAVVYVQVYGRKKWIIYTPEERIFLDPRTERRVYFYSQANPDRMTDGQHSMVRHGKKYEITLEAGDVLWFPPFAWHYVENLTDSIGVAYKYSNIQASWRGSKMLTTLYFLATRPNAVVNFIQHRFTRNNVDTRAAAKVK